MPKVPKAHLEQRREQILDAAIACFARKGFEHTTMADIAAQAGVSDTLAYRYFSGKDELIEAAVRRHGDSTVAGLLGEHDGVEDFRSLLDMLIDSSVRRFEHPEEMKTTMGMYLRSWAEALHDEEIRQEVVSRWHDGFDIAEGLITRAQQQGQLNPNLDSRAIAWVMLAAHYGANILAVVDPEVDLEKGQQVMVAMVLGGLAGETTRSFAGDDPSREEHG